MEPAQQQAREAPAAVGGRGELAESGSPGRRSQAAESGAEPSGGGGGQLDGKGTGGPRRRRGGVGGFAPPAGLAAGGTPAAPGNANSLLLRRGRLKRNLSAAAASPAAPAASLGTRSLDRKALLLKPPRQLQPLQPPERDWVRRDLQRGCVHLYERHMNCYLRPVLCTLETTAAEVAARLQQLGHRGGSSVNSKFRSPQNQNVTLRRRMNRFLSSASTPSAMPTYLNKDKTMGLGPRGNEELECL
ncbi:ph domain leucine-rich repeat-containing protein phosphatase 1 [Limosa lapponica baueri]|uniref:Ph domain leucine-rich repeat-containing protein phosphatase 1 n=1 Tax=Limosa lapponica baueri TaxID=1758121 RepID=A0A2I0UCS9_LIMLA|nr:ph domain leucine-rich repeat-containing protein phosphatase 1 [Limosa lapponica baueri]